MYEITQYVAGRKYTCRPFNPKSPGETRNGDVFYIFWTDANRRSRRKSTGEASLAGAQAYFQEWLTLESSPVSAVWTCEDLYRLKYPEKSVERADAAWRHLAPVFAALAPADVTPELEARYVKERRRVAAAATVRAELGYLRSSWNLAVRRRVIASDALPVLDALPPDSPPRDRWLTDEEIGRVLAAAEEDTRRVRLFVSIALDTAARRTAIQELQWDQVDWDLGVIHFLASGRVQTRKKRASVPISTRLRRVLEEAHRTRDQLDPYVIGAGARINGAVGRVAERAGVKGVTPHVFRHTAATHMARRNVSIWVIANVLGCTVAMVQKRYAKWLPGAARDAVEQIGGGS